MIATKEKNPSVNPVNAKDAALIAAMESEHLAQANAISSTVKASGAIGPLGLERLARELGESTNAAGRPTFGAWIAFVLALMASGVGYATQNRLCALANKSITLRKKNGDPVTVCKSRGEGSIGQASCSYRVNTPAKWAIAVGE